VIIIPFCWILGTTVLLEKNKFKFEKWWLEREDFRELVLRAWSTRCEVVDLMELSQIKVRTFRRLVIGWARNVVAELNRHKQVVATEFHCLDMDAEVEY
jgi:hypothetical protein